MRGEKTMEKKNVINIYSVTLKNKRTGNCFSINCTYFDLIKYAEKGCYELKRYHKIGEMNV